ncbi:MAG: hypothetical protein ACXVBJ_07060 [Flavisolibacter sp.]
MEKYDLTTNRRAFIGTLATGAAAMSLAGIAAPLQTLAKDKSATANATDDPDAWFKKLDGKKHKIVFDATEPHQAMPFVWSAVFMMTNAPTPPKDLGIVVILRHEAIPFAFEDKLWSKYNFGEVFKANDLGPAFKAADYKTAGSTRNPLWHPKDGDFQVPGFGNVPIGINQLQDQGVMFAVCNAAMTVYSAALAQGMNKKPEDVLNEWKAGLLPGVQIVPSGVWAVGRAQEHGCAYCFAG